VPGFLRKTHLRHLSTQHTHLAALLASSEWYPSDAFSAQWELAHDGLAVMLGLFGLVYRYGKSELARACLRMRRCERRAALVVHLGHLGPRVIHTHTHTHTHTLPAVRQDPNPQLKQGVVGAFVITRALSMLQASEGCTALPLSCGAPLGSSHL